MEQVRIHYLVARGAYDPEQHLAEWAEAGPVKDYHSRMEWAPVWAGVGLSALLGLGMWVVVRLVAWAVARGWL